MKPRISVIVPVYKAEKFMSRCIDSILNQTYRPLEVILVDDGSPDSSGQICERYKNMDDRVKVIHQKNAGVSAARNAGLDIASGNYITFVDSDDYICSNMYEKMMECMDKFHCELVICDCMKKKSNAEYELYTHKRRGGYYSKQQLLKEYYPELLIMKSLEYPLTISNCTCLFKNMGNRVPRYKVGVRYSEDWLFGCKLIRQVDSFYYMKEEAYYIYNCSNLESATHTVSVDKWNDYKILFEDFQKSFLYDTYDFSDQLNKVLLFMVCNECADIFNNKKLSNREKTYIVKKVLYEKNVRGMFKSLKIRELRVSLKLKLLIWCYKYPVSISFVIKHMTKVRNI